VNPSDAFLPVAAGRLADFLVSGMAGSLPCEA
jgi:hypothetical protein